MVEERTEPRISVNKLGEYLVAAPVRRRRIITDQKRPSEFIVTRYRDAAEAMIVFLENGAADDGIIEQAIEDLGRKAVSTDFQEQDRDLSIEALIKFLDMADTIPLDGLDLRRGDPDPQRLQVEGVLISVRPEIVLSGRTRNDDASVGLLKLYLSKTYPLTDEAGEYVGTVLQHYAACSLANLGIVDYRLCKTLDVFSQRVHTAPRSYRRRLNDIEAACQEIARAWEHV